MNTSSKLVDLELAKRALSRPPDTAQQVACRAGTLWITQDNDPRDIILEPGESFTVDGHRPVILYALQAATLTMRTASAGAAPARQAHRRPAAPGLALE